MTQPSDRSAGPADPRAVSERTGRAVETERRRREAEQAAAHRRSRSPLGRALRILRWLRNRQTGPLPRLRRVGGVLAAAARGARSEPALLRRLPDDLATAVLAPVRVRGPAALAGPSRSWEPERAAARRRLAGEGRPAVELGSIGDLRLAAIADESLAGWLRSGCETIFVRPEDWRTQLEARPPQLLAIADAWWGNGGSWQYRVAWHAHPDALLLRDLRALVAWCAERGVPSVFLDTHGAAADRFAEAAALCDLIVAPDEAAARRYLATADRRGAGVAIAAAPAGPASAVGILERVAASCAIRVAGPAADPLVTIDLEAAA